MRRLLFSTTIVLPSIALFTLSIGAPDGCNTPPDVGVESAMLAPGSPNAKAATKTSPIIVKRDNLKFGGGFTVGVTGVSSKATNPFSADGKWTGLTGHVALDELNTLDELVNAQMGPLLPRVGEYSSPGVMGWTTRFGTLVHGNLYSADLSATAAAGGKTQKIASADPLWIKLSDDVKLVPVVVISYRKSGGAGFVDMSKMGQNMFDFIPYSAPYQPELTPPQLTFAEVESPNKTKSILAPDTMGEIPPDDIFSQCDIQFQVVATFTLDLPPGFVPNCDNDTATFLTNTQIQNQIRAKLGYSKLAESLVKTLDPLYVAYGDMGGCTADFFGKAPQSQNTAEVNLTRPATTTAHELGHVLDLDHADVTPHNLMRTKPAADSTVLTAGQCEVARQKAESFDKRYRLYNAEVKRVIEAPPPVVIGTVPGTTVCCGIGENLAPMDSKVCAVYGGSQVPDNMCQVCCASGVLATTKWSNACSSDAVQPKEMCDLVCCSNSGNSQYRPSRYECLHTGGAVTACPDTMPTPK